MGKVALVARESGGKGGEGGAQVGRKGIEGGKELFALLECSIGGAS